MARRPQVSDYDYIAARVSPTPERPGDDFIKYCPNQVKAYIVWLEKHLAFELAMVEDARKENAKERRSADLNWQRWKQAHDQLRAIRNIVSPPEEAAPAAEP